MYCTICAVLDVQYYMITRTVCTVLYELYCTLVRVYIYPAILLFIYVFVHVSWTYYCSECSMHCRKKFRNLVILECGRSACSWWQSASSDLKVCPLLNLLQLPTLTTCCLNIGKKLPVQVFTFTTWGFKIGRKQPVQVFTLTTWAST